MLDLDHLGAQFTEERPDPRRRPHPAKVEHAETRERAGGGFVIGSIDIVRTRSARIITQHRLREIDGTRTALPSHAKRQSRRSYSMSRDRLLAEESSLGELPRRQHFAERADRRHDQVVLERDQFELGFRTLGEPRHHVRIDLVRISGAHRAQRLVSWFECPRRIAHRTDEALPFLACPAAETDSAVFARQDHVRVRAARSRCATTAAMPCEAVMDIEPAVTGNVARQHVGQRDVDDTTASVALERGKRGEHAGREHRTGLMRGDAGRQRQRRSRGLAE